MLASERGFCKKCQISILGAKKTKPKLGFFCMAAYLCLIFKMHDRTDGFSFMHQIKSLVDFV